MYVMEAAPSPARRVTYGEDFIVPWGGGQAPLAAFRQPHVTEQGFFTDLLGNAQEMGMNIAVYGGSLAILLLGGFLTFEDPDNKMGPVLMVAGAGGGIGWYVYRKMSAAHNVCTANPDDPSCNTSADVNVLRVDVSTRPCDSNSERSCQWTPGCHCWTVFVHDGNNTAVPDAQVYWDNGDQNHGVTDSTGHLNMSSNSNFTIWAVANGYKPSGRRTVNS